MMDRKWIQDTFNNSLRTEIENRARTLPVERQPVAARAVGALLAEMRNPFSSNVQLRQSIIRGHPASRDEIAGSFTAWATVLFDLANLHARRPEALAPAASVTGSDNLNRALTKGRGVILAVPHLGSLELLASHLISEGHKVAGVYHAGDPQTEFKKWTLEARTANGMRAIRFEPSQTAVQIVDALTDNGIVLMPSDVWVGSDPRFNQPGIETEMFGINALMPPGPARFAASGFPVVPGYLETRTESGIAIHFEPEMSLPGGLFGTTEANAFTLELGRIFAGFISDHPGSYWLVHEIADDPFLAFAQAKARVAPASHTLADLYADGGTAREITI